MRCLAAASGGVVAIAAREFLQPVFGDNNVYTLFYPVVILVAFACEPWLAAAITAILAVAGYWCFTPPTHAWAWNGPSFAALVLFVVNCSVAILLIQGLVRTLRRMSAEQGRAEAVAAGHAELFRELNERVTHHLHLVSGVLALQARDEPDRRVANALLAASEQSGVLARVHREFSGRGDAVEFASFARALVRTALKSQGRPEDQVVIDGPALRLEAPQATSLAVALLECLRLILARGGDSRVAIQLGFDDTHAHLQITDASDPYGRPVVSLAGGYLLSAMLQQLGGHVVVIQAEMGAALDIVFPLAPHAAPNVVAGADFLAALGPGDRRLH